MNFTPRAYPLSFCSNEQRGSLEYSNQIILAPEILASVSADLTNMMVFTLENNEKKVNVGVYEFSAPPDICYMPYYFMTLLGIKEGDRIQVKHIQEDMQKATAITLKPQEQEFLELNNPKVVLEYYMSRFYPIISLNDIIRIQYNGEIYCLSVSKLEPSDIVSTIDSNITLEFEKAHDDTHVELPPTPASPLPTTPPPIPTRDTNYSGSRNTFIPFQGTGNRLGSH